MTTEVRAEMAATVWRVTVAVDSPVNAGDTLVILESMKMEIPVEAPVGGRVVAIAVAENDHVAEGDVIAVIG